MAQTATSSQPSSKVAKAAVLRRRLQWSVQPILLILVALFWVLNPEVVDRPTLGPVIGWAFVYGVGIAIIAKWSALGKLLNVNAPQQVSDDVYQKNRVPEEFYWGHKEDILFEKSGK